MKYIAALIVMAVLMGGAFFAGFIAGTTVSPLNASAAPALVEVMPHG